MKTLPSLTNVRVESTDTINGNGANYIITVNPSIAMYSGDIFYITFPAEIGLSGSPSCSAVSLLRSVSCSSPSSKKLKVQLTFSSSPNAAGNEFKFSVSGVTNAPSTETSSAFTDISASDSNDNPIALYSGTAPTVKNLSPAPASGSLTQNDLTVSRATIYTITYTTKNDMKSGASFLISYPTNVGVPSTLVDCGVTYNNVAYSMTCTVNSASRTIKMTGGGLNVPTSAGR